jgi:hypothetical protein
MGEHILEFVEGRPSGRIDRATAAIFGVKILGAESQNPPPHNNSYPLAMRQRSVKLFEGMRVFVDHPARNDAGQTRPYQQAMGLLRDVREAGDGLRANWLFPPQHPLAPQVLWDAEHAPNNLAFSINATAGKIKMDGGRKVIESLEKVHSVDLVSRGATVKGLFESRRDRPPTLPPREPASPKGIWAARSRALDKALAAGQLSRRLQESLLQATSEQCIQELLQTFEVDPPRWLRSGADVAKWAST